MFGSYRLVLAVAVALSHFGVIYCGFNPGQWAVICFYVLSGFLMERQYKKLQPSGGYSAFYLDRFLRIYPVYFIVALLGLLVIPVTATDLLLNFSLLPMNYLFYANVPPLVGPAWSLACEAHFYLLVPFLAAMSTRTLRVLTSASLACFYVAVFIDLNDLWGYQLLPGILFTFLSGMLINRQDWVMLRSLFYVMIPPFIIFSFLKVVSYPLHSGLCINISIGYFIALPATLYLSRLPDKVSWDRFFGLFSYPLFLVHTLIFTLFTGYMVKPPLLLLVLASLLAAGALIVLVEKPMDVVRYRVRRPGQRHGPSRI